MFSSIRDSLCLKSPIFSLATRRELRQNNGKLLTISDNPMSLLSQGCLRMVRIDKNFCL
jgi:hypothetical protein